jgi:tRNA1Val (adenine37-N6)-methyltransferase
MSMELNSFRFKQFSVLHDRCAHKVGTDAVLLGAWTTTANARTILDIGTGSGVIALMLAQRTTSDVSIDAVELNGSDFLQATENILNSSWSERIKVHHASVQEFVSNRKYDLIASNPPFFVNDLLPPSDARKQSRHTISLSYADLLVAVKRLISPIGKFSIILPSVEGLQFQSLASEFGLFCSRELAFFSRKEKSQERWLMEFDQKPGVKISETLVLYAQGDNWSEEYKKLTHDFYLRL